MHARAYEYCTVQCRRCIVAVAVWMLHRGSSSMDDASWQWQYGGCIVAVAVRTTHRGSSSADAASWQ